MKISSKKPFYKRKKIIAMMLIVAILAAGAVVFALTNINNSKDADSSKSKANPEKTEEKTKKESVQHRLQYHKLKRRN